MTITRKFDGQTITKRDYINLSDKAMDVYSGSEMSIWDGNDGTIYVFCTDNTSASNLYGTCNSEEELSEYIEELGDDDFDE